MGRVPRTNDPKHDILTMDDFIKFADTWMMYKISKWKGYARNKFTMASLVIVLLDYVRIRLFNYLL